MPNQRVLQKSVDKQDKIEVEFLCLHLSAIFGHNVTHVLRQSLTLLSVFTHKNFHNKQTHFSNGNFLLIFNENIFLIIYKGESASRFWTIQTRSKSFTLRNHISTFFSLMTREKCIVNNVRWKIPNDNYSRDSHLEQTEYTGS